MNCSASAMLCTKSCSRMTVMAAFLPSDGLGGAQAVDLFRRAAQLGQDGVGMLTQSRDRVHARCIGVAAARRQQRRDRTDRSLDLRPAPARLQLWVAPDIGHR